MFTNTYYNKSIKIIIWFIISILCTILCILCINLTYKNFYYKVELNYELTSSITTIHNVTYCVAKVYNITCLTTNCDTQYGKTCIQNMYCVPCNKHVNSIVVGSLISITILIGCSTMLLWKIFINELLHKLNRLHLLQYYQI